MDSKKTCSTCTYWDNCGFEIPIPSGACKNEKIFSNFHAIKENNKIKETTPIDGISCNGIGTKKEHKQYVKTGRDFGCIHHKTI